ncbi:MAG: hypothetical protein ACTSVY_06585 [Candidatus Helarchaeota archaeon]
MANENNKDELIVNEEEKDIDKIAENFFKQIGIDDLSGAIEFAKSVESDVKKREKTLPKKVKTEDIEELKKILEKKEARIDELENKVLPAFVLMIKDYLDQIKVLKKELKEKEDKNEALIMKIKEFKEKIQSLKSKWF